ncbi:uncharacterized protein LOC142985614 [Anticarsia gemmatalis]|uniref:uncharacterized protein LOC142985614 n=1 Tax=Anticarsia gemmatalis TaxID=129554 RepID=UPI003F76407D
MFVSKSPGMFSITSKWRMSGTGSAGSSSKNSQSATLLVLTNKAASDYRTITATLSACPCTTLTGISSIYSVKPTRQTAKRMHKLSVSPDEWYRAVVLQATPGKPVLQLCFVDYGNIEEVPVNLVRKMLPEFVHEVPFVTACFKIQDFIKS